MPTLTDLSAEERAAVTASNNIRGLDTLNVPLEAIGGEGSVLRQGDGTLAQLTGQPPEPTPPAAPVTDGQPEPTPLTAAERVAQDEELAAFLQAEKSRAVTGYKNKRDQELAAQAAIDAQHALNDKIQRAAAGDQEAKDELADSVIAEYGKTQQDSAVTAASLDWLMQQRAAIARVLGDDPQVIDKYDPRNFPNTQDWQEALVNARVERELAAASARHALEIEQLSEAKAIDIVAGRRQNLPVTMTDLNNAVQGGGFQRTGTWTNLGEASRQWNTGQITQLEYEEARRQHSNGMLPVGPIGLD